MDKRKLALLVGSMLASLSIAELSLTVFRPIEYRRPSGPVPDEKWSQVLHQRSLIPELSYELTPNRNEWFGGVRIRVNSFGMRDREPLPADDASVCTVAVMGDSFTFGFGVPEEGTYPKVLERLFSGHATGKIVQVLNLGVGGYSTRDEAIVVRHKALPWRPALIIMGYVLNDPENDPTHPLHGYYREPNWWQYSNILRLVAGAKHRWDLARLGGGDFYRYLHDRDQRKWQSVVEAFGEIATATRREGVPVVLVVFPMMRQMSWPDYPYGDIHRQVADAARSNGFHVVDLYDTFSRYPPQAIVFGRHDPHPRKLGHELAAQALYQAIEKNSLLVCR